MALTIFRSLSRVLPRSSALPLNTVNPITSYVRNFQLSSSTRNIINIQDEDDFRTRVVESDLPVIVDFHANWCGPCKILGPKLEQIIGEQEGRVVMAKVDIDDNGELAMAFKVQAVPTVMAMKDGKVVDGFMGLKDEDQLKTFVAKVIAA